MRVSHRGLAALRYPFVVVFVVVWNAALLVAFLLEGGPRFESPPARALLAALMLGTSLLAAAIIGIRSVRDLLTAPTRRALYNREPYLLICLVTLFIGLFALFTE